MRDPEFKVPTKYLQMERQPGKSFIFPKIYSTYSYSQFRSLFKLPTIYAAKSEESSPTSGLLSPNLPVQPVNALEAAAEELRRKVLENRPIVSEIEIQEFLASETGWNRLIRMYTKDHEGFHSPELWFTGETLLKVCGLTFVVTSYIGSRHAGEAFVKTNKATAFRTNFQASRMMTDRVVLAGMQSGFKWTYRVGFFSSIFLLLSQSIAVYRNKSSVLEYFIASGITGAILKANLGLKGMVGGGLFGGIMGLCGGSIIYGFMLLTNETQEQRHYWSIQKYLEIQRELQTVRS